MTPDKTPDGGPAFPTWIDYVRVPESIEPRAVFVGMSLRDYFAGQLLASGKAVPPTNILKSPENVAEMCYRMADAMLKERERGKNLG